MVCLRKPCFLTTLLLFLLLVSVVHGAEIANAADTEAAAADGGKRTTVRTGAAGHAGHGSSSSHSGSHPNGGTPEQGGAGVVDPRNLDARGHHRKGAASRVIVNSSPVISALVGALLMVALV